ncbi:MAG: hypothetical protein Q7S83_03590 [bacterium]|nr:hypothetical protein [bacterium]
MKWEPTSAEMMKAVLMVLMDKEKKTDCLFWHGSPTTSTAHNREAAITIGRFYKEKMTKNIFLNGHSHLVCSLRGLAYPGLEVFTDELERCGVRRDDISIIAGADHTAAESETLLKMMHDQDLRAVTIVTAPHHQLRCFLQIIASMKKLGIFVKAYNRTFHVVDWSKPLAKPLLGGGTMDGTLVDHVQGEYDRIVKYAQKDGVDFTPNATIPEMFEYLRIRDEM